MVFGLEFIYFLYFPVNMALEGIHAKYLRKLVHNIDVLGIDRSAIYEVYVEPEWLNRYGNPQELCDLILNCHTFAVPVELKASLVKREKAISQLYQGKEYALHELGLTSNYGFFVVYDKQLSLYQIEQINF